MKKIEDVILSDRVLSHLQDISNYKFQAKMSNVQRIIDLYEQKKIIKTPLPQSMSEWSKFLKYIHTKLIKLTGNSKVTNKQIIRIASSLKKTCHYPESNLTDEVLLEEYNSLISLSREEPTEEDIREEDPSSTE